MPVSGAECHGSSAFWGFIAVQLRTKKRESRTAGAPGFFLRTLRRQGDAQQFIVAHSR